MGLKGSNWKEIEWKPVKWEPVANGEKKAHYSGTIKVENKLLYYRGNLSLLNRPLVAIVGTRRPLKYSRTITYQLARLFASAGIGVVSGGAEGIDREAHLGSFPNTVLVSPSSLDHPYPKGNRGLIERIGREGVLLSQYRENFLPRKYTFLERNRIIIQMASLVIIPEGKEKGGSANSYRLAKELKKPVWTIAHRMGDSPLSLKIVSEGGWAIWTLDWLEKYLKEVSKEMGISTDSRVLEKGLEPYWSRDTLFGKGTSGGGLFGAELDSSPEREALRELFSDTPSKF